MNKIIAITGTKGKTSLVRVLEYVLKGLHENVLRVDTSGAYYNGGLKFSDDDSRRIWGYAATNAPGRFLAIHGNKPGISLLECTLFSARTGLGYKSHDIGVFTNVYEDHIGSYPDIQTKDDIARMKSFVFSHIKRGGFAIYNADDAFVCSQLLKVPSGVTKIAASAQAGTSAPEGGYVVKMQADTIELRDSKDRLVHALQSDELGWLTPTHRPSVYLALFAVAALFAFDAKNFETNSKLLQGYEFDSKGGRMVKVVLKNGATVILDYAHETVSLQEIGRYARTLADPQGKVLGVLRLAPSRTDKLVQNTAQAIYDDFDEFVIYDKVDGYFRQPKQVKGYSQKSEQTGRMAELFAQALLNNGDKPVHKIIREDEALEKAVNLSCKGDVIVYIVGDDSARSRQFVSKFSKDET